MSRFTRLSLSLALLLAAPHALAQDQLPEGHAPVSEEALRRALGEGPPVAMSQPSPEVPVGSIDVSVIDESGAPLANTRVRLGTMNAGASSERFTTTDANGHARFTGLDPRVRAAHRVTLDYQGARTLTTPFTLDPSAGQAVLLRRLQTTQDLRVLLQRVGQVVIEFRKANRLHVSYTTELLNLGERTLVFPGRGLQVRLPRGFSEFQSERSMNDQRVVPNAQGFRIAGSVPPGRLQMQWSYELPYHGSEAEFTVPIAFRQTAGFQVATEAAPDMELDVPGFADAEFTTFQGRRWLHTEVELTPEDAPLRRVRIRLRNIPGPGLARWVAIAAALGLLGWGLHLARTQGQSARIGREERAKHAESLLDELEKLAREHADDEVGDVFFRRERERVVDELARLAKHDANAAET